MALRCASEFRTLSPDETLRDAAQHIVAGFQQDFRVIEDRRLVGILTRGNLLRILAEDEPHLLVKEAMNKDFLTVLPSEMLESAFQRLQTCECRSLPVVEDGKVLGIHTTCDDTHLDDVQHVVKTDELRNIESQNLTHARVPQPFVHLALAEIRLDGTVYFEGL